VLNEYIERGFTALKLGVHISTFISLIEAYERNLNIEVTLDD
jgi:hypothetical protein